jgi:ATP-binding cassette subfamily B protein
MKDMLRISKYILKYWPYIIVSVIAMLSQVAAGFIIPLLMGKIIDESLLPNNPDLLYLYGAAMIGVAIVGLVAGLVNNYSSQKIAIFATTDLRKDLFDKIQRMSFTNLDKFKTSRLITTTTNDMNRIKAFYQMLFRIIGRAPLMVVFGLVFAISTSIELSQIYYISIPLLIISIVVIMIIALPKFTKVQKTVDNINKVALETASAPRVIKSFVTTEHENKKFAQANKAYKDTNSASEKIMALAEPIIMFIMNASLGALVALGAYYIDKDILISSSGTPAVGTIITFNNYSMQTLFGLLMFAMMMIFLARAQVSAKRILQVMDENIDLVNSENAIADVALTGELEFDNVSFGYGSNGNRVLKNLSFKIKPGETVGIIGSTGSGKTSLINLVPRLYDVSEGEVKVNGINVKDIDIPTLRSQISIVTQNPTIFSGSIGTNIVQGNSSASMEELKQASNYAAADEFIMSYDDLFNHKIEQGGSNLSGGQKQRLSLARAFVRDPRILILDDSTSAVDAQSEQLILDSIKSLSKNLTALVIAQKISTIKEMDKIIVLNNKGRIDGFGTHEELLQSSKVYKEIALSQLGTGGDLDA